MSSAIRAPLLLPAGAGSPKAPLVPAADAGVVATALHLTRPLRNEGHLALWLLLPASNAGRHGKRYAGFSTMLNGTVINLWIPGRVCPRLTCGVPPLFSAMAQVHKPAPGAKPVASNVAMSLIPKPAKNCFCKKSQI